MEILAQVFQFLCIILSFLFATFMVVGVKKKAVERGMLNQVEKRSSHKVPTPRGGGLAFVKVTVVFSVAYSAYQLLFGEGVSADNFYLLALTACSALVAFVGWRDDISPLGALPRLASQFLVTGLCLYFLPQMYEGLVPFWVEKIILAFAWVWFINLYNFMDGLDGFAAQQGIFLALVLSFVPAVGVLAPVCLVLMGSVLGFLRLNYPPAKIFMGDVGSTYLGFMLGGILFWALSSFPVEGFAPLLTLTLLFTADATYTLFKRALQGKKPWQAHKEHWYQRAHQAQMTHAEVLKRAVLINVTLGVVVLFALLLKASWVSLPLGLLLLISVAWRIKARERKIGRK